MSRPRVAEIFNPNGIREYSIGEDALTAVVFLAFHPRTGRLILAGGNSSGRVTVVR